MEREARQPGEPRRRITRDDVMTASEVGDLLGIPTSTVYRLARNGTLPSARLGRTVRFLRDDVEGVLRGA
jgi:excisionase family DNA binding protein